MALQRPALSLPASTHQILRIFAPSFSKAASYQCPQNFHSTTHFRPISRRKLVTTTSYRPHSFESYPLHPPPAPPRNTGIPDSSIAGTKPELHDTRPPNIRADRPIWPQPDRQDQSQTISLPESEAQKSKPVPDLSPATATPPPRKSRLRARKAAMTVTPAATAQLRNLLAQPDPKLIRVGVRNRGCSGLAYHLEYVEKPAAFDEAVEQDGVKVLIDSKALFSIIGSEMDWVEDKLNQRFVFRNPNISKFLLSGGADMVME
ncbi:MAG: hypothetical protein L6R40_003667 [Gallowayella cf. fulva]|nr:MAG: hypothetical protein L6R40_003667 [Xanthomendoza cf. fulva]